MSEVKKPHYNSRFLTEPWEVKDRRLRVYDFDTNEVRPRASKSLFVKAGMNSSVSDKLMSKAFEGPIGEYRKRSSKLAAGRLGPIKDYGEYRALLALIVMQPARVGTALVPEYKGMTVDQILAHGESVFDHSYTFLEQQNTEVISVNVPGDDRPFFPSTGYFLVPVIGHDPLIAVPLTPRSCIILRPRIVPDVSITCWFDTPLAFSSFSVGVGGHAKRVVIPPDLATPDEELPALIKNMRKAVRQCLKHTLAVNTSLGLRPWKVDD